MSSVGVIIQARINSSRLPGKVMKTIDTKPMLSHVLNQVNNSKNVDIVILATSDQSDDDVIEEFCKNQNQICFRGSKNDLLDRYYKCAKQFNLDIIVRITSDCPLIDPVLIDKAISKFLEGKYDYVNDWPGGDSGPQNLPGVSIFKKDAEGIVYHTYSVYGSHLLELVEYNFMFDITPDGRPSGKPEMPFLKHKDQYEYPNGDY